VPEHPRDAHGARHPDVRVLRAIARDRRAREDTGLCLLEGPRVISAALDRSARLGGVWFGYGARPAFSDLDARLKSAGVAVHTLKEGVLEKVGTTRTPQPVLATARLSPVPIGDLAARVDGGFVVVAVGVADPGNLGTILRSAEAAGAAGVIVAGDSVDVRNPKVVRASAGALFGIPVAEVPDPLEATGALRDAGVRVIGAVARGGDAAARVDLTGRVALVVGNEARGVDPALVAALDATVTIPMAGAAESLNVAMAATVLCFEAARQRAEHEVARP
jgi:TrmH family RNA methyltransferase